MTFAFAQASIIVQLGLDGNFIPHVPSLNPRQPLIQYLRVTRQSFRFNNLGKNPHFGRFLPINLCPIKLKPCRHNVGP